MCYKSELYHATYSDYLFTKDLCKELNFTITQVRIQKGNRINYFTKEQVDNFNDCSDMELAIEVQGNCLKTLMFLEHLFDDRKVRICILNQTLES